MTKKNLDTCIFLILTIVIASCKNSSECLRFKNGTFYTISPVTKNKIIIERNDSLQIETDVKSNIELKSKIVWKDACEYEILAMSDNKTNINGIDSFFSITPIRVKIIDTGKDFYVFKARVDSINKYLEYSDTIHILK
jgi:hypothetical protein